MKSLTLNPIGHGSSVEVPVSEEEQPDSWRIPSGRHTQVLDTPPASPRDSAAATATAVPPGATTAPLPRPSFWSAVSAGFASTPQTAPGSGGLFRRWTEGDAFPAANVSRDAPCDGAGRLLAFLSLDVQMAWALAQSAAEARAAAEAEGLAAKLEVFNARSFPVPRNGHCGPAAIAAALEHRAVCAASGGAFPDACHLMPHVGTQRARVVAAALAHYDVLSMEERAQMNSGIAQNGLYSGFSEWAADMRGCGYADELYMEFAGRLFNAVILVTGATGDSLGMTFPQDPSYLQPNPR